MNTCVFVRSSVLGKLAPFHAMGSSTRCGSFIDVSEANQVFNFKYGVFIFRISLFVDLRRGCRYIDNGSMATRGSLRPKGHAKRHREMRILVFRNNVRNPSDGDDLGHTGQGSRK
jgi:hypothetical protein